MSTTTTRSTEAGYLTAGLRYEVESLTVIGWTAGDGSGHDGYDAGAYFAPDGAYLGPDAHGIEPLMSQTDVTAQQA